jgi:thiosulfate/3-mercaptopyruvate sulfurtransferase
MGRWRARLGSWGITPTTPVIVYDASSGAMAAARAWWMLRAVGHASVFVVDGGWRALRAADSPIERGEGCAPDNAGPYSSSAGNWPVVDASFVEHVRRDPSWRLIDARAPERYRGDVEPLDPVAGHIPGARNLYWQSQVDGDGLVEARARLEARYTEILDGVEPNRVVCYCGSGVTACHLLLTMEACELRGAKLYVGSWSEWCRQSRPRAAG